jgi:hypothetical protein
MKREIHIGYEIINNCIKKMYDTSLSDTSFFDKDEIYDRCLIDIKDCLYWIKYEREKDN